jgi:ABC-type tungstate transport system substrate-binding protein
MDQTQVINLRGLFIDRGLLLTRKLLNQGFLLAKMKSSLRKFYDRHRDLVDRYGISVLQMITDMFHLSLAPPGPFNRHDLSPGW